MIDKAFTIVVAVNNEDVLRKNLLQSPGLLNGNQLIVKRGFTSASLAYNSAIDEADNDIIIFIHQDIYLPETWLADLKRCLEFLEENESNWGVLGCFGSRKDAYCGLGRVYTRGLGRHGQPIGRPEPVDTLDEIVLIIRKSGGLRFDPRLPHFHLYGPDICLTARSMGMVNYAFQGFCVHNTNQLLCLPEEFYACYRHIRRKWMRYLPIYTSCMVISFLNQEYYRKRIEEAVQRLLGTRRQAMTRVDDPRVFGIERDSMNGAPNTMDNRRYFIITPVRDECGHIEQTIEAVKSQTVRPARWIVVDDGSTDGTGQILDRHASVTGWMYVVHRPNRGRRANGEGVMEAFYAGYEVLKDEPWDYLVKLDGDLSFPPDYFERCLAMFEADVNLGIGGGTVYRLEHGKAEIDSKGDPPFHVRGATKIYRRACWEVISPLVRAPGWDTIDEVKANLHGWATRTFGGLTLIQHKPTGGADGAWRNAFKNGRANYITGYHPAFMIAKCIKRSLDRPVLLGSTALLSGFVSGYLKRVPRGADERVIRYLRRQQVRRLLLRPSIYA